MNKENIGIAKEGYPIIGLVAVSALASAALDWEIITIILILVLWFSVFFFRDPERVIPIKETLAVCPADGKIIKITKANDPFTHKEVTLVSIFMNVFSVHVNRTPIDSTVTAIEYHEGTFLNAAWDKASTDNERCLYALTAFDNTDWTMVQISGLIARRIVCRTNVGAKLDKGSRYGMIRFGSRVDIYIPNEYTVSVKIGDSVFAGQTILAEKNG